MVFRKVQDHNSRGYAAVNADQLGCEGNRPSRRRGLRGLSVDGRWRDSRRDSNSVRVR